MVLTTPQHDYYPGYLTVKMIDFGGVMDENQIEVFDKERGVGTYGWGPPVSEHIAILYVEFRS